MFECTTYENGFFSIFQSIVRKENGEIGRLARNHVTVANKPDREVLQLRPHMGERNALKT